MSSTLEEEVLASVAPELAEHVQAFLEGGHPRKSLQAEPDWAAPSTKLRALHDALAKALRTRKSEREVAILAVAVRLQSVVLFEAIKRTYRHAH